MEREAWRSFEEVARGFLNWARKWKEKTGVKVIGHLLPDVPEELICASGAMPFAIEGVWAKVSRATEAMPAYTCTHALGLLEMGLEGELDFLDGLVIPYVCDTTRNLYHTWDNRFPGGRHYFLRLPKRLSNPGARDYLRAELRRLGSFLGEITGCSPAEEELICSLELYEKSRARLREAYSLYRKLPSVWTLERLQWLVAAALRMPRDLHLEWMEALPWGAKEEGPTERVPVYVRGKVWDPPGICKILDELGFIVVGDEVVTGYRSVEETGSRPQDPFDALIQRLVSLPLYPGYHLEPKVVVDGFIRRVKASGAKGVILLNPKFCEMAGFDTPDLEKALRDENIPALLLETSTRGAPLAQIRVRLEAFREMLGVEFP